MVVPLRVDVSDVSLSYVDLSFRYPEQIIYGSYNMISANIICRTSVKESSKVLWQITKYLNTKSSPQYFLPTKHFGSISSEIFLEELAVYHPDDFRLVLFHPEILLRGEYCEK